MTLFEEMISAGRGIFALFMGSRDATRHFDFTLRGLIGSIVGLIIALTLSAYLPSLLGTNSADVRPHQAFIYTSSIYLFQMSTAVVVLRQLNRLDAVVPYLVADNWATFIITLLTLIPIFLQVEPFLVLMVLAIVVVVVKVNIARLIVTLTPWKIVLFLGAHLLAGFLGQVLFGTIFNLDPTASLRG